MRGILSVFALLGSSAAYAQAPANPQMELASLREDVRGLVQRVGELTLRIEELERQNKELAAKSGAAEKSYVTLAQMNAAVAEVNAALKTSVAASRTEVLQQVVTMMDKLGKQTNAALDSVAKGMATRAPVQTNFSEDFPKEGISYTVQPGESIAVIARKTGAKQQDIINANKISDPSKIQAGQTLFIPGGK